jgi:hypothetical protein
LANRSVKGGSIQGFAEPTILTAFVKARNDVTFDVYLATYDTKFKEELKNVYENLIGFDFHPNVIGADKLISCALQNVRLDVYDFLVIARIDLFMKPLFTETFNPAWEKIMWPSLTWKRFSKLPSGHPRISDMMLFVPKKYFQHKTVFPFLDHNQWERFVHSGLGYDELDTMLHTLHDSDSEKDFNPLYYIVNRPECRVHHSEGELFDKRNFN